MTGRIQIERQETKSQINHSQAEIAALKENSNDRLQRSLQILNTKYSNMGQRLDRMEFETARDVFGLQEQLQSLELNHQDLEKMEIFVLR